VQGSRHLCKLGGQFLAMKGQLPTEVWGSLAPDCVLERIQPLQVPGLTGERCAVFIKRH